jgi:hypothetical protein
MTEQQQVDIEESIPQPVRLDGVAKELAPEPVDNPVQESVDNDPLSPRTEGEDSSVQANEESFTPSVEGEESSEPSSIDSPVEDNDGQPSADSSYTDGEESESEVESEEEVEGNTEEEESEVEPENEGPVLPELSPEQEREYNRLGDIYKNANFEDEEAHTPDSQKIKNFLNEAEGRMRLY